MLPITSEGWTLPCQNTAERDELLAWAEDYGVPVCGDRFTYLPECLSLGWCKYVGALVAYQQTGPDGLPSPGVREFRSMCARYATASVLA